MRNVGKLMIVIAVGVGLAACSNSEQASSQPPGDPVITAKKATSSAPASTTAPASDDASASSGPSTAGGPQCTADKVKVAGAAGAKPTITIPTDCAPPTTLLSKDLVEGTGAVVKTGSNVTVNYDLVTWSDHAEQDSSFGRNEPFTVQNVGQASVIEGWNEGLDGLRQGGRRLLIVPPDKGYGAQGQGKVKPNETLVFVIDAVAVS
ncbi:FKBP-type peptidyl-prolyl cis-trans isomerase [Actinokineospora inagensis]|uniref:FKBP-type peptidyl-prolyl cis-trans isomerase n=1 Tax=Actinokineospora inagensis TaxID=103730 RepID=UPI000423B29B|nr:FKBP-type peptidyl-prolyl cis-trans isomerase [Actinokineospora inagensis]